MGLGFFGKPIADRLFEATPFTAAAKAASGKGVWATWGENALPEVFAGISLEVAAVRNAAMIEDKSPLAKIHIHGPDAERFVDRLIPRDATAISIDHANYTPWCDDSGKVIVEGLLFRLSETDFIVTAGSMDQWFSENRGTLEVEFADVTDRFGILAMQGPDALAILEEATGSEWGDLRFSRGRAADVGSARVHVWRTGFTGVKGYEFWVPPQAGSRVWEALRSTRSGESLAPCGHAAQDVVRVEAGMVLPAIDYARAGPDVVTAHGYGLTDPVYLASPYELDLGRFVDLVKSDFAGIEALRAEAADGSSGRRLCAMRIDWRQLVSTLLARGEAPTFDRKIRRHPPMTLVSGASEVGFATSIGWSPTLRDLIGFAHVRARRDDADNVHLRWDESEQVVEVPVALSALPFIKPSRR